MNVIKNVVKECNYFLFLVKSDRCNGSYNTLDYSSGKICVVNKIKDTNLNVFNMNT